MKNNSADIYEKSNKGRLFSPFNLRIDEMKHLLLIGFEKDPDEIYGGLEPQLFEDPIHGKGLRVIGWRRDGYVDVYQQPSLLMDKNFDVAGKGLADILQRDMENMRFNITSMGVDIYFSFEDKKGRKIEVSIRENGKKPAKPFSLLAPVGSSSEAPSYLPIFYLYGFYFVRRTDTDIEIKIDGTSHKADTFPFPMDGTKIYFMRYSKDPFISSWNRAYNGALAGLDVENDKAVDLQGTAYKVVENLGNNEIERMYCESGSHRLEVAFDPPVPDITSIRDQADVKGQFIIESGESAGTIGGVYQVQRNGDEVEIKIHPCEGWKPNPDRWITRLIFTMAAVFRKWPKSYLWTAKIKLNGDDAPIMNSSWKRI